MTAHRDDRPAWGLALALAAFFGVVQFYTSLAALSPTPPVGYLFATRAVAFALVGVLVASAAYGTFRLLRDRAAVPTPSREILAVWIGSAIVSGALGFDPGSSLQVVGMMLLGATFHIALVRFFPLRGVAEAVLGTYLTAGLIASLAALVMVAARRPAELWALNHGRAAGFFVTANQFAAFLIAFIFIAFAIARSRRGTLRALGWGGFGAGLVALAATFSQAGLLGAGAGALFLALATGARRVAIAIALVAALGIVAGTVRPTAGHDPADAFDRLRVWQAGLRVAELFPLTGVGPMAYWRVYPAIRPENGDRPGTFGALHPHDAYLSLAAETGAAGLVAFGYGWWRFGRALAARLRGRIAAADRYLGLGVCAALVAVLVQGIFDTIGVVQMTFVWIPLTGLALAAVGERVERDG